MNNFVPSDSKTRNLKDKMMRLTNRKKLLAEPSESKKLNSSIYISPVRIKSRLQNVTPGSLYKDKRERSVDSDNTELLEAKIANGMTQIQEIINTEESLQELNRNGKSLSIIDDTAS